MSCAACSGLWSASGCAVVVVRRRSIAVGLVTVQALVLVGLALDKATGTRRGRRRGRARVRALSRSRRCSSSSRSRTRERRPVRAGRRPVRARGPAPSRSRSLLTWLVPTLGLASRDAERAVLALVAFGLVSVGNPAGDAVPGARDRAGRERARARRARAAHGPLSLVIELGVAFDLTLIALVAAAFHARIFAEFGAGDSALLRSLRD